MSRLKLACLVLSAFSLAGCETLGLSSPTPMAEAAIDVAGPACPSTAVLADAASVTKFKGPYTGVVNPADVILSADMTQAKLSCDYDRKANTLSVDASFAVRAMRGPAASGGYPELTFFVAVINADNVVVAKQIFTGPPDMAGKAVNIYRQNISGYVVPMAKDTHPSDYEIMTGFQLSPEELAYNHTPRALPVLPQKMP